MDKVLQEEVIDPVMKVANEPDKPKTKKKVTPAPKKGDK